jgi:hypothetical protein
MMSGSTILERNVSVPSKFFYDSFTAWADVGTLLPDLIERVECDGNHAGSVRTIHFKETSGYPGVVRERLDAVIDEKIIIFSVLGSCALPFIDYVSYICLDEIGPEETRILWSGNWQETDIEPDDLNDMMMGFYSLICDNLEQLYRN